MNDVAGGSLLVAAAVSVAAGAVSFASPCVLPLVPGYLGFVSGLSGAAAETDRRRARLTVLLGSSLFVLGFAVFFTLVGGAFGAVGYQLAAHRRVLAVVGGAVVIALGVFMLGVVRPASLESDTRLFRLVRRSGVVGAFPLGLVFAAGWTPCIGPTLASILTISAAGSGGTATRGAVLGFCYALGLGLPFVAVGQVMERGVLAIRWLRRRTLVLQRVGGSLLLVIGVLLVTGLWDKVLLQLQPTLSGYTPAL